MLSTLDLPNPICLNDITKDQFVSDLQAMAKPFVIRGFAKDWAFVSSLKNNSAGADLLTLANDHSLAMPLTRIPFSEKSRMFYNENMDAMNFGVASLPLDNVFKRMLSATRDADYAAQCVPLARYFPALLPGLNNPLVPADCSPFIWFGNKVIVAPHYDESDNLAVVLAGKRRFTLFPPDQIENLYIGPLEHTPAGQAISLVNILEPDLHKHPRYEEAYRHAMSVELSPGDAIYIPTPWWHHVQSMSDFNILINYWWNECALGTAKPMGAMLHSMQAYRNLPTAQRQAFRALFDYYVFGDATRTHDHLPKHVKGILTGLSPETRQGFEQWVRDHSK
ncbi:MAG: cupin-like domain-containing protein [Glaciecola sp.]